MDDNFDNSIVASVVALLYSDGLLDDVIDIAVNGTENESFLGYYPGGSISATSDQNEIDRNVVAAAFHVLGNQIAQNAHPLAAYPIIIKLIELRNNSIGLMEDLPR